MKKLTLIYLSMLISTGFLSCANNSVSSDNQSSQGQQQEETSELQHIDQSEFQERMNDTNTVVLDVRTQAEVESSYIEGADLFIDVNSPDFEAEIAKLDKSKNYLVYCRSGGRSTRAGEIMVLQGFTSVYNLKGGIMNYTGSLVP